MGGQIWPYACRARDRVREFAGMRGAEHDEWACQCVRLGPARGAYADGGVRVGEIASFLPALGDLLRGFGLGDAERVEFGTNGFKRVWLDGKPLRLPEPRHQPADGACVPSMGFEKQAFEIRR